MLSAPDKTSLCGTRLQLALKPTEGYTGLHVAALKTHYTSVLLSTMWLSCLVQCILIDAHLINTSSDKKNNSYGQAKLQRENPSHWFQQAGLKQIPYRIGGQAEKISFRWSFHTWFPKLPCQTKPPKELLLVAKEQAHVLQIPQLHTPCTSSIGTSQTCRTLTQSSKIKPS